MLNELDQLRISLQLAGINPPDWHNDFVECPNSPTFYVLLDKDGVVESLEMIVRPLQKTAIRKYEIPNTGVSFPAFNVLPILCPNRQPAVDALRELEKTVKQRAHIDRQTLEKELEVIEERCDYSWDGERDRKDNALPYVTTGSASKNCRGSPGGLHSIQRIGSPGSEG